MEEWKEYPYTELCSILGGGTPKTSEPSYWNGNIPWLSVKDFGDNRKYVYSTEKHISQEGLENSSTKLLEVDDIIISARGTIGAMAMLSSPMAFNQSCFGIRGTEKVDQHYLYYLTKTKISELQKRSHGSVFETITRETFSKIICRIPSLSTQKVIAQILSSLDDKIEINRRINENLEQQAQALFKSWFVDFEPFRDQPFVESELGMIPEGWKVGRVGDICKFENGFAFKSDSYSLIGDYKIITIKNVQDGILDSNGTNQISCIPHKMPDFCHLNIGDVLLSLTGNVGRCCLVTESNLLLNQRVAKIKPTENDNWGYVYSLFRMPEFKDRLISIARGTAQANLSPVETSNLKIVLPPSGTLKSYSDLASDFYQKIIINMRQSEKLSQLRDTRLPRLMSGELKVQEIEESL